jgi:hypothetical protein
MSWRSKGERFAAADCAHAAELGAPLVSYSTHVVDDARRYTRDPEAIRRLEAVLIERQVPLARGTW